MYDGIFNRRGNVFIDHWCSGSTRGFGPRGMGPIPVWSVSSRRLLLDASPSVGKRSLSVTSGYRPLPVIFQDSRVGPGVGWKYPAVGHKG